MNADGTGQTRLTDTDEVAWNDFNWEPSWSPDGEKIAFATNSYDDDDFAIHVVNADDGSEHTRVMI